MPARKLTAPLLALLGHRDPETRTELNRFRTTVQAWLQQAAQAFNQAIDTLPITGSVTLAVAPATTTTISDSRFSATSRPLLFPATANAAIDVGAGTLFATSAAGVVTITHAALAPADRTFHYAVFP